MGGTLRSEFPFVPRKELLLGWMMAILKARFHINLFFSRMFIMAVPDTFLNVSL